jgi:prepilin-type N-terminal cleavage/methylation domain-containing protein
MNRTRHSGAHGFTMMELIIVLVILGILTSAVVPMYARSLNSVHRNHAVRDLLATLKYAQERAISDMLEHRVYFDPEKNQYWIERFLKREKEDRENKEFEPLREAYGNRHELPESLKLDRPRTERDRENHTYYIPFYPNGACGYATIRLKPVKRGEHTIVIETEGAIGRMKVKE